MKRPHPLESSIHRLTPAIATALLLISCGTASLPSTSALLRGTTHLMQHQSYRSGIQGVITFDTGHISGPPSLVAALQKTYRQKITESGTLIKNRQGDYSLSLSITNQGLTRQSCAIEAGTTLYYSTDCKTYIPTATSGPSPLIYRYTPMYLLASLTGARETGLPGRSGPGEITVSGNLASTARASVIAATASSLGFSSLAPAITILSAVATMTINPRNYEPSQTTLTIAMAVQVGPLLQDLVNNSGTGKPIPDRLLPQGELDFTEIITTHPGGFGGNYPVHLP